MNTPSLRVTVFGLGYVGCVTAACLADRGHVVTGVDVDDVKVGLVNNGRSPVIEPSLDELVASGRAAQRLQATVDLVSALADADVSIVCVGTPSLPTGELDLSHAEHVAAQIGEVIATMDRFHVVMFRSTMLPGSIEERLVPVLEASSAKRAGVDFGVAVCPEFLREASGVADFFDPPFTVAGCGDDRTAGVIRALFAFLDRPLHVVDYGTAEALKYACNAFHAVKITFANEVGRFCQATGADSRAVLRLLVEDDRLNISPAYLAPGFAYGGSCLPKDLRALLGRARSTNVDVPMLSSLAWSNELVLRRATRLALDDPTIRRVALVGLSFKPGTDDLRESPYMELAETLLGKGIDVRIYDTNVNFEMLRGANRRFVEERLPHLGRLLHADPAAVIDGVDAAFVSTAHPSVVDALLASPPPRLFDLNGRLPAEVEALPGYVGISW